jgi:anionic cell wall polymer biosynthesis LytR-Cps2A-Psr (LCP) family protein
VATVVAVMDGPSFGHNTDVIVVVSPRERTLTWVPRDLWSERLSARINKAYAHGGHEALVRALTEQGIEAEHSICVRPDGIRPALEGVSVSMPIRRAEEFDYEGEWVRFEPPIEELTGERIHQWIGARKRRVPAPPGWLPDLDRIRRQQELVAVMLGEGLDFSRFVAPGLPVRVSGDEALEDVAQVEWDWVFLTIADVEPAEIDGQQVLIRKLEPG